MQSFSTNPDNQELLKRIDDLQTQVWQGLIPVTLKGMLSKSKKSLIFLDEANKNLEF